MKIIQYANSPFPAISIDNFIPNESILRAAAVSFDNYPENDWVKYQAKNGQVQYCSKVPRKSSVESLMILDFIAKNFNPSDYFLENNKVFPDVTHYGGGMMLTPNKNKEGGFLGYHVDALIHGVNKNWKREYSAVLCLSEEYDKSFDLILHDGIDKKIRIPYKFNRLNVFKCSEYSWHGIEKITPGMNRKALGVMYWSQLNDEEIKTLKKDQIKAKFMKI